MSAQDNRFLDTTRGWSQCFMQPRIATTEDSNSSEVQDRNSKSEKEGEGGDYRSLG